MYFTEALKDFAALSEAEHDLWLKQKSEPANYLSYKTFCEQAFSLFADRLPTQADRVHLYHNLILA